MMKENRFLSFLIITIIYILATVVGVLVWHFLPFAYWLNLLLADVAATIFVFKASPLRLFKPSIKLFSSFSYRSSNSDWQLFKVLFSSDEFN